MTTTTRIVNFSAGPAVLPVEVLEQAQRDLLSLPGVGMSILEISHRSKPFDDILEGCEADLRALAGIPDGYHVLFLQGGASLQFSMVPMNLLSAQGSADYIVTGAFTPEMNPSLMATPTSTDVTDLATEKLVHRSASLRPSP